MLSIAPGEPLASNDIAVWYWLTTELTDDDVRRAGDVLSAEERARRDRRIFAHDRRDFSAAHALLRHVLSRYGRHAPADWSFDQEPQGKPALIPEQAGNPPLAFNLSHTDGLVACAIGIGRRIGVDVEHLRVKTDPLAIAGRFFASSEMQQLEGTTPDRRNHRFADFWTLKESYIKAIGSGLTTPLDTFSFALEDGARLRFAGRDDGCRWRFVLAAPSRDTRLAVAGEERDGDRSRVRFHRVPESAGIEALQILAEG